MREYKPNHMLYTTAMIATGAALTLIIMTIGGGHFAHAQGKAQNAPGAPGGFGYGTGGIPAVMHSIEILQEELHARLDLVDAELAALQDTVTPRAFDATVDICFELAGGFEAAAGIGMERKFGVSSFVGIDMYGNGMQLTLPGVTTFPPNPLILLPSGIGGEAGAHLGGSAGLNAQFCVAFPVHRLNELAPDQGDLADAIAMAADSLRDDLVAFLGDLGFNASNVQAKVAGGRNLMATFPHNNDHVLNMLHDGAGPLVDLIDVMPLNFALKDQVINFTNSQVFPANMPGLNVCNTNMLANTPSAFLPLVNHVCGEQQDGLALRDSINTTLSRVTQVRSTVNEMRPEIACMFCNMFPVWCLFNPCDDD